jgi:hypothetical protein
MSDFELLRAMRSVIIHPKADRRQDLFLKNVDAKIFV